MTDSAFAPPGEERRAGRRRLLFLFPVAIFVAIAIAFAWGLTRNPGELLSVLIGRDGP